MFHLLADLWLANQHGDDRPPHRPVPPMHLCGQVWKFVCVCRGEPWTVRADAVWRDGEWRSPIRQCAACRAWTEGARIES